MTTETARKLQAVVTEAAEEDLDYDALSVVLEEAICDRREALERERVRALCLSWTVPLSTILHVHPGDATLEAVHVSEACATGMRDWQSSTGQLVSLVSIQHLRERRAERPCFDAFLSKRPLVRGSPCASLAVAFVPCEEGLRDHEAVCARLNDFLLYTDKDGLARVEGGYDVFVDSVLASLRERKKEDRGHDEDGQPAPKRGRHE